MPVSVMCDAASVVNAALRESIANSSNNTNCSNGHNNNDNDAQNLQNKLVASTKRILLTKIEYEEVSNYNQSVLDTLKSKYIILKPSSSVRVNQSNAAATTGNDNNDKETTQNISLSLTQNAISGQQNGSKDPNQLPQPKRILYPKENVQIGWKNCNRKWQIGAGMLNVGNTCYLNSTLQALFHVPAMANWLISDTDTAHSEKCVDDNGVQGGCIICAMSKTLIVSQTSQTPIRPYLVYSKLKLVCKHLTMGRQEDAHEFLRYLVEAMEKAYLTRFRNWKELDQFSKETTPLNQILGGYLKSAVRCLACGHVSTTFQHFQDLLLDIRKASTLEEALDVYFARERLEDMGYRCEACKKKVSATKQFSLERAPISLCIQLKRFSMMGTKLNKQVTIRPRLDLSPYASRKNNSEQLTYRLVAMVTHLGASQHCGHYTAIGVTDSGGYYQFDDSCVRPISAQNVLNTNAYIIFYELEDSQSTSSNSTSTQISGEHNHHLEQIKENFHHKMNGQILHNNNDNNIFQRQNNSPTLTLSNNKGLDSKLLGKLDTIGTGSVSSTATTATSTTNTIIGPQLPDKILLNGYKTSTTVTPSSKSNQNGLFTTNNSSYHKLVNSPSKLVKSPNKTGNNNVNCNDVASPATPTTPMPPQSAKQKLNNNNQSILNSKLVIHFKNTNTNSSSNNTNLSLLNTSKLQGLHNPNNLPKTQWTDSNKTQTENVSKKSENSSTSNNVKVALLPSMPKLESLTTKNNSSSNSGLIQSSPNKTFNSSNNNNSTNKSAITTDSNHNPKKISLIKSLVPYESDDDSSNDSNKSDVESKKRNELKSLKINASSNNNKSNYVAFDESSSSSSSSLTNINLNNSSKPSKSKTPPSPPVVKSKTGLWQVTSVVNTSSQNNNNNNSSISCSSTEKKNPFASNSSFSSIYSSSSSLNNSSFSKLNGGKDRKFNGGNRKFEGGYTENNNNNNNAVNQLLKHSHRGYGAPVLTWNGQKTEMEKEVSEENRLERKRELRDDEENEMDRGKQKKIKIHNNLPGRDNPGYNPFQEYQNSQHHQQQQQRRWSNNNNNNHSVGHSNSNGRYHHGQGHNNNNNNLYRQNNSFYRNHNNFRNRNHRFHNQRSHHSRSNNNNFHHRRDS